MSLLSFGRSQCAIVYKNSAQLGQYVNPTYSAKHLLSFKTISQKVFAAYSVYTGKQSPGTCFFFHFGLQSTPL